LTPGNASDASPIHISVPRAQAHAPAGDAPADTGHPRTACIAAHDAACGRGARRGRRRRVLRSADTAGAPLPPPALEEDKDDEPPPPLVLELLQRACGDKHAWNRLVAGYLLVLAQPARDDAASVCALLVGGALGPLVTACTCRRSTAATRSRSCCACSCSACATCITAR
jgi:hypothetical protein